MKLSRVLILVGILSLNVGCGGGTASATPTAYWGKDNHSTTDTAHNADQMEEAYVDQQFSSIRQQFVDKGVPVVLGEYAAMLRTNLTGDALALHKKSRIYYINYVTRSAVANGALPFYWDVGGLIDRGSNNAVLAPDLLDALIKGVTP